MNLNTHNHSVTYVKRQAKRIKKALNLPHHEALDQAASILGYSNWRNFLSRSNKTVQDDKLRVMARTGSKTLGYIRTLVGPQRRPNGKMPISVHKEVGRLLKEIYAATYYRKGVYTE